MEDETTKKELDLLRIGIQEAILCSEFVTQYVDKGKQRDDCLKTTEDLVKCYCLLDNHLQIRPGIVGQMQQEESLKIAQFENAETPDAAIGKTEYAQKVSEKVMNAVKHRNVANHEKFKDFKKKVQKFVNKADGAGDEDDLMVTEESSTLIDPISKREFVDPVISLKCRHRFSRRSVMEHLKGNSRCPYVGCKEKFGFEDLEDDVITAQALKRHQLTQSR